MAWLRIRNLPQYHYTDNAARLIVYRFGKFSAMDYEKTRSDYSTLDVLVECADVQEIPCQMKICYDELYTKTVRIEVAHEIDVVSFDHLGYDTCSPPYEEVYQLAF